MNVLELRKDSRTKRRMHQAMGSIADVFAEPQPDCWKASSLAKDALQQNDVPTKIITITTVPQNQDLGYISGQPQSEHLVNLVDGKFVADPPCSTGLPLRKYLALYRPKPGVKIVALDGEAILAEYQQA